MNYQHVLAAIDGSDDSERIIRVAKDTAASSKATLSLLSVVNPLRHLRPGYDATGALKQTFSLEAEIAGARRERLTQLARELDIDPGSVHVEFGSPATVIHRNGATQDTDLIVIGSHARHGIGLLLGSTANAVLRGATCNVLVVRLDKHPETFATDSNTDSKPKSRRSGAASPHIKDSQ